MKTLRILIPLFILGTSALMVGAFSTWTEFPAYLIPAALGIIWIVFFVKQWWGWANISILGFVVLAFIRVDLQSPYVYFSLLSALIAWDLVDLFRFLDQSDNLPDDRSILGRHYTVLGVLVILSSVIFYSPRIVEHELSFGWLLLVSLIVVLTLTRGVYTARRKWK